MVCERPNRAQYTSALGDILSYMGRAFDVVPEDCEIKTCRNQYGHRVFRYIVGTRADSFMSAVSVCIQYISQPGNCLQHRLETGPTAVP